MALRKPWLAPGGRYIGPCWLCDGGQFPDRPDVPCRACEGRGWVLRNFCPGCGLPDPPLSCVLVRWPLMILTCRACGWTWRSDDPAYRAQTSVFLGF